MKYCYDVEIAVPISDVIAKFDNENNLKHWQKGFISMEHLGGTKNQTGATSKLTYQMGNRQIEIMETITLNDLPKALHLTFDTKGVYNIQENYFEELANGHTKWRSVNEFKFGGFMKLMSWFMPGAFKKQTCIYMDNFKAFAEEGKSVLES